MLSSHSPSIGTTLLGVYGMTGAACERRVRRALEAIPGVTGVGISREYRQAVVAHDPTRVGPASLADAVAAAGYAVIAVGI